MSKINTYFSNRSGKLKLASKYTKKIVLPNLYILGTQNATNEKTGSMIVQGGLSSKKNLYIGGKITSLGGLGGTISLGDENDDNITIKGNLSINGNIDISGDLVVSGSYNIENGLNNTGDSIYNGITNITGSNSSLITSQDFAFNNNLNITGSTKIVSGITYISGTHTNWDKYNIYNQIDITGGLHVTGNSYISNDLVVSGDFIVSGNIIVPEVTTNNVIFSDNLSLVDNLFISGTTTIYDNLNIIGPINIKNNFNVTGNTSLEGKIIPNNADVTITNSLSITGNINMYTDITLDQPVTIEASNGIDDIFNISGSLILSGNYLNNKLLTIENNNLQNSLIESTVLYRNTTDSNYHEITIDGQDAVVGNGNCFTISGNRSGIIDYKIVAKTSDSSSLNQEGNFYYNRDNTNTVSIPDGINNNNLFQSNSSYDFIISGIDNKIAFLEIQLEIL